MWIDDVDVVLLSSCDRWIEVQVTWQSKTFILTGIYGDPVTTERDKVWEQIIARGETRSDAWFMIGDFNELYNNEDKRGGRIRPESSFLSFRSMLTKCGLLEVPFEGNPFSWFGTRGDELIHCKLDRVVANIDWFLQFPAALSYYLPRIGSDHSPVLTKFFGEDRQKRGHFRFDSRWVDKEGFNEAVQSGWTDCNAEQHDIIHRIRSCRNSLAVWKRRTATNSKTQILDLKNQLDVLTHEDSLDWNVYQEFKIKLAQAYNEEEVFWKNKSRIQWLKGGDRNSKFFHASVKQKRVQNRIKGLLDENTGIMVYSDNDMGRLACSFYASLYTSELVHTTEVRRSPMFIDVVPKVSDQQCSAAVSGYGR